MENKFIEHFGKKIGYRAFFRFEGLSRDEDYVLSYYIYCLGVDYIKRDEDWMMICCKGFADNFLKMDRRRLHSVNQRLNDLGLIDVKVKNNSSTYIKVNCDAIDSFIERHTPVVQNCTLGDTKLYTENKNDDFSPFSEVQNCTLGDTKLYTEEYKNVHREVQNGTHYKYDYSKDDYSKDDIENITTEKVPSSLSPLEEVPSSLLQQSQESYLNVSLVKEIIKEKHPYILNMDTLNSIATAVSKKCKNKDEATNYISSFKNAAELVKIS